MYILGDCKSFIINCDGNSKCLIMKNNFGNFRMKYNLIILETKMFHHEKSSWELECFYHLKHKELSFKY